MANASYVIRGGVEGRARLRLLSEVMSPSTSALLAEVGIPQGAACLDVGCGGGDVTLALARVTGANGRVLGVDFDATKLSIAREEAAEQDLDNVAFELQDVTQWPPDELFDVVYARFLLTHLPDPAAAVSSLRQRLGPGGVMIIEDIDFSGHFSEPACPALQRYVEFYTRAARRRGADPNIGPRLPRLLREAGLADVRMQLVQPAALEGGVKSLICVTLESIADTVINDRIATAAEVRETREELEAFASDPHTVLGGPRIFQVWGRNDEA